MWLPSTSPRYQGISSDEYIIPQKQAVLTYRQRFDVITTERVWKRLGPMLDDYLPHKEESPAAPAENAKNSEEQPEK